MNISIYKKDVFEKYHSKSQIARVLTENWFEKEMYCPACLNSEISRNPNNTKVVDFCCDECKNLYQLKSQTTPFHSRVLDGAFRPMINSIIQKNNPSFCFMHYSNTNWEINNLLIVPKFFFTESIIEKRKPLSDSARRHGWIGCNVLLSKLPLFGKIKVIDNYKIIPEKKVQAEWKKLTFLNDTDQEKRTWLSDILVCIDKLKKQEFNLDEIYAYEEFLSKLHPENYHIKPKIRQQLQFLRDRGVLEFKNKGTYLLK